MNKYKHLTGMIALFAVAFAPLLMTAADGTLVSFLGAPRLEMHQVFKDQRFPNLAVAKDGSVLASWGSHGIQVRRSIDGGASWAEPVIVQAEGFQGGGMTVDDTTGDVLMFIEDQHPPAPLSLYRSRDHGQTWDKEQTVIRPNTLGHVPSMHMNDHGSTLHVGKYAGRLIRPTRWYAGGNRREEWPNHYTNAIFSDDHGKTWQASEPFPEQGTGEACIVELSDGSLYYNSRVHWEKNDRNTRRRSALSRDGGRTWTDFRVVDVLPDGHQHRSYGCMGGLTRLPVSDRDILLFSNLDTSRAKRERMTLWLSADGGQTWPIKRLVYDGPSAYSSMQTGRHGTPSEGWIYLMFEGGGNGGAQVARMNLAWVLEGVSTGDGELPAWIQAK
ncbi:MAG: sialidase family protein [Verrucomicrobiota bacterium]|nr:sialidase family protein [Verrucomicrobiota bacterium]